MAEGSGTDPVAWIALHDEPLAKQKRARGQLSCVPCRVGKLKCNRVRDPGCDQCIKRNREDACHYVPPPSKAKPAPNVKGRIRQLEGLVRNLMEKQNASAADQSLDDDASGESEDDAMRDVTKQSRNVERSFGKLDIGHDEISYKSQEHWQAILSSLTEIQNDLGDDDDGAPAATGSNGKATADDASPASTTTTTTINHGIFGATRAMTREEILQSLPDKRTLDRLLSLWFNSPDPFKVIIHAPTYQEEYKRLWQDQDVSEVWLASLFAILCIAESFGLRQAAPGSPEAEAISSRSEEYRSLAASALVLADFTKPKDYVLESLLLYMIGMRGVNASLDAWLVMGLIVRLALRMGYHRDPDFYSSKVSPFQGEMRRRVWAMIHMIDVLMSFQLGLPSMVRTVAADTQPPRNLLDRDFAIGSAYLPGGRPENELTPCLYTRAKLKLVHVFSEAAELSHVTTAPATEDVLKLDKDLEKAKAEMPLALQMPDISEVITDSPEQLMCRFNLDLLYLKCKIVLFRRYMLVPIGELSEHEQMRGIGAGREACIKSARRVLTHHHTIYTITQPGGQMEHMKWYMGAISTHDFLLAAMVLCLELSQQLQKDRMLRISNGMQCPTRTAMMTALEQTYQIWTTTMDENHSSTLYVSKVQKSFNDRSDVNDVSKARKAMAVMLARLKSQRASCAPTQVPSDCLEGDVPASSQYFDNMGITPKGARQMAQKKDSFHGVLTNHQWDVPADFVYPTPGSIGQDGTIQNTNSTASLGSVSAPPMDVRGSLDYGDVTAFEGNDADMDWQIWAQDIFNAPHAQEMDWLGQDLLASDVSMPTTSDATIPLTTDTMLTKTATDPKTTQPPRLYPGYSIFPSDRSINFDDMGQFDMGTSSFAPFLVDETSNPSMSEKGPKS